MKKFLLPTVAIAAMVCAVPQQSAAQCGARYQDDVFTDVDTILNVKYGENYSQDSTLVEVFADIYLPEGDVATDRPLAIVAHGGSFYGGTRTMSDVVGICEALAKKGYVAASISYRLTTITSLTNPDNMIKAVMQAVQDGKGAIRFFKNSVENGNPYGIDSTKIFIGGSSAGAILSYHLVYMNDLATLPANWQTLATEVGGLEGNTGNPEHTTTVVGTFGYAGALADTSWLQTSEVPFMGMHAEDDATVPYGRGYPLGLSHLPVLYGTSLMHVRADNQGVENDFYSYTGTAHPPYNGGGAGVFDSTIVYTARFMYKNLCTETGIRNLAGGISNDVVVYPNPSTGTFNVRVAGNEAVTLEVFNHLGQRVSTINAEAGNAQIDLTQHSQGIYLLHVRAAQSGKLLGIQKLLVN